MDRRVRTLAVVLPLIVLAAVLGLVPVPAGAASTPAVGAVAPSRGPSAGGNVVVVTGSGFTGATGVRFGPTAPAAFTVQSDTRIDAVAPPGPDAALVNVWVDGPGGSSAAGPGTRYFYSDPPVVTGVSPASGPTAGGTTVTIEGSGFRGATAVRFTRTTDHLDVPAPQFTVVSDTRITVVSPVSAEESGEVQVLEGFRISPRSRDAVFSWVEPMPAYTGTAGTPRLAFLGDSITEIASATLEATFTPHYQVSLKGLGGRRVEELQPYATELAAGPTVPPRVVIGLGSNDVLEHHLVGLGDTSYPPIDPDDSADRLEALVASLAPATTCVVLTTVNTALTPDPVPARTINERIESLAAVSAGRIQVADWDASVQEHAAREGEPGWQPWLPDGIHPNLAGAAELARLVDEALDRCTPAPPVVTAVAPTAGPSGGGNEVVLTGTGFTGTTSVRFGPVAPATIRSVSDTRLVVTAPPIVGPALVHVRVDNPRGTSWIHGGSLYYVRP